MMSRMDLVPAICPDCAGTGKDSRKRKRPCPRCTGSGRVNRCSGCGHLMPCPGTDNAIFDQTYCNKPNVPAEAGRTERISLMRAAKNSAHPMVVGCTVKYYVQRHASGCVGNCFLWWRKGGNGYTCNLDDAEVFDGDDARFKSIAKDRSKYTAWEKDYIDSCAHRHVDHQYVSEDAKGVRTANKEVPVAR